MTLTIIIPFWNGHTVIDRLLNSLPDDLQVIIVDDHSDVPLQIHSNNVTVYRPEEKGYFTGAVNYGIERCDTDVLVLNQDTWFTNMKWIELIYHLRDKYALIGERTSGLHPAWPSGYIHGTFMFMRRDAITSVGLMNAETYPLWGSTCEWQLMAARKGFNVMMLTDVPGFHHARQKGVAYGTAISEMLRRSPDRKRLFIKTPPEISVIIPCYNYGRYLKDAVNSLIGGKTSLGVQPGQTFQSFEIIIIDDGSTDNSVELARKLVDPLKGVRLITQVNAGKPDALNVAISTAYGRFIAIMDADDMMEPWRLEELRKLLLAQTEKSFVYDDFRVMRNGKRGKHWKMQDFDFIKLLSKNHIHTGIMFPMDAWQETGGYPENMTIGREDWAFNIALAKHCWCGVRLPRPGYLYRREGQGRTTWNTSEQHRRQFAKQIRSTYPELYNGEIDVMAGCCDGQSKRARSMGNTNSLKSISAMPGANGMVLIEYIGTNLLDSTWFGPVTQTRYVFGGVSKRGYVDSSDAPGFLKFTDTKDVNGAKAFKLVTVPKKLPQPKSLSPIKQVASTVLAEDDLKVAMLAIKAPATIVANDPNGMSVKKLRTFLSDNKFSHETIVLMISMEEDGKGRTSAIKSMEAYLG